MTDVAARAGVALGTVSNVLNHPDKVASATRKRVHAAIDELGFVPNIQARSLAMGRSTTLGLVVTDIGNSFFVDIARGAEAGAADTGMTLLLANSDNDFAKQETYLDLFDQARFAGILLAPFEAAPESVHRLRRRGRPVLLLNVAIPVTEGCSITVDNEQGGYLAARHLIDGGRRRLAFVGGPDRLEPLLERRLGAERAVAETNGAVTLEEIIAGAVNAPEGRAAGSVILDRPADERPDGIFAASDLLALGLVQTLSTAVSIPDDIAVIGYDNNTAVRESSIPISTIAQPGRELGEIGARLLWNEVTDDGTHQHEHVVLEPTLIARGSSVRH
ncbi:LacI family DNA-binding transcriptional regulator [Herbiconiux liangxiaofengii]|uniref:LacI family DNA-binding transcriptional regulator n=1 Tax=Herbiconiux liangxiaofengii TaxID=3342795 RepID=UPI0035B80C15